MLNIIAGVYTAVCMTTHGLPSYDINYVEVGKDSLGKHPLHSSRPIGTSARTKSRVASESVQRYHRRDRILFYYTRERMLRSYYTHTHIYVYVYNNNMACRLFISGWRTLSKFKKCILHISAFVRPTYSIKGPKLCLGTTISV